MAEPEKPQVEINNPDAGIIKVIVTGPTTLKSDNPLVVIVKG